MRRGVIYVKVIAFAFLLLWLGLTPEETLSQSSDVCIPGGTANVTPEDFNPKLINAIADKDCRRIDLNRGTYNLDLLSSSLELTRCVVLIAAARDSDTNPENATILITSKSDAIFINLPNEAIQQDDELCPSTLRQPGIAGIVVAGLVIRGSGENAIRIVDTDVLVRIANNHIKGNKGNGISVRNTTVKIEKNNITDNGGCAIQFENATLFLPQSDRPQLDNRIARDPDSPGSQAFCGVSDTEQTALRTPEIRVSQEACLSNILVRCFTDFPTIQEAIDAAVEGEKIFVAKPRGDIIVPYQLTEPLSINKSLTLEGEDRDDTILQGINNDANVIDISAAPGKSITIQGLTIMGGSIGIKVENDNPGDENKTTITANDVNIENNTGAGIKIVGNVQLDICSPPEECVGVRRESRIVRIENNSFGISAESRKQNGSALDPTITIRTTTIENNRNHGIFLKGTEGGKPTLMVEGGVIIQRSKGGDGVNLQDAELKITNPPVFIGSNSGNGIAVLGGSRVRIAVVQNALRITIQGNQKDGILLEDSATATLDNVTIENNNGLASNGIRVTGCATLDLKNTEIIGNLQNGLLVEATQDCSNVSAQNGQPQFMHVSIDKNTVISGNERWGIAEFHDGCFFDATLSKQVFRGRATGDENHSPIEKLTKDHLENITGNGRELRLTLLELLLLKGDLNPNFCPKDLKEEEETQG